MAYIINRYNGTVLTTVEDGTLNTATEVKFVGKNYAGYGEAQNENFLFLLENFSGSSQPAKPVSGMIWHDNNENKLKFYTGSVWKTIGGAQTASTDPTGAITGDIYFNTSTNQLFSRNASNEWVLIGPQSAGTGTTQMRSVTLTATTGSDIPVIISTINDEDILIISPTEFTIASASAIEGFDVVKKGITLVNTKAATSGITSTDHRFWGTASNAESLNGLPASSYLTASDVTFTAAAQFYDTGFKIGDVAVSPDLTFKTISGNRPVMVMHNDTFEIQNSSEVTIHKFTNSAYLPGSDSLVNIGSDTLRFATVYADVFDGIATEAGLLTVSGTGRAAATAATVNTIAARDSSGNLTAVLFNGTATKARYADLAEKYSTATELPAGTAVAVCTCEDHEVEPASASQHCIGVVSTDPAYMMNSEANGQYIGLKGRVPVRVKGAVRKGDVVYALADGVCTTLKTTALVGIALESNATDSEKLVECVLKV
tara:strand:- start:65359 stop:66816 length:1458 start_codon:yes stop_codon:yes gene_type:complete